MTYIYCMRNLIVSLIFFAVVGYSAKLFFNNFEYRNGGFEAKLHSYPDEVIIENQKGTEIQVILLGRNSTHLEFNQKDGRKFIYPISSLSNQSQVLVMQYPENGIEDASEYLSTGNIGISDVYIMQLETEMREIRTEIGRLENKATAATSQTESRTLEREINKLREDIVELEDRIAKRR